jgi:type III restriction enzyme
VKVELRDFQKAAVSELIGRLDTARYGWRGGAGQRQAVGLAAPTGAGKTIIATAVIERLLFGSDEGGSEIPPDPGAVVLWMTDLPELNLQTQDKMLEASSELTLDRLPIIESGFNEPDLRPGRVYFLNTQKLGARADLVKRGPLVKRTFTFWDVMRETIEAEGRTLYLVVDEAHRGMTEKREIEEANSIIQRFIKGYPDGEMPAVPIVLGISATPERFRKVVEGSGRATSLWEVPPEEVRASGLIKEKTLAEFAGEKQTDAMALFPEAVRAWRQSTDEWAAYYASYSAGNGEPQVVPALIVQVENESPDGKRITQTDLDAAIKQITDIAGNLPDAAYAHAFGEARDETVAGRTLRYLEPSKIARDGDAKVVFFKTSLGTGWDCPRAEVLFSFRRAVDPTSIAQTVGRMVRTPLARHIEENDDLNACAVFLPHYNRAAVDSVVKYLTESGNEAVAGTITSRREVVSLSFRSGCEEAVAALQALPQHLVPTFRARPPVRVLVDLATFVSSTGIDRDAFDTELATLAKLLVDRRDSLASDAKFQAAVDDQSEITIEKAEWLTGEAKVSATGTMTLPATQESISRLFATAGRRLTGDLAAAYVRARLATDAEAAGRARLEAYELSRRESVTDELNRVAQERIDALRQAHGRAASKLPPVKYTRYKAILRQAPDPSHVEWVLPEPAQFVKGDKVLPRHLYAEPSGDISLDLKSSWEVDTIKEELGKLDVVAWLRNDERAAWAFCVPWLDSGVWRPFYPDLLLVRRENGGLVVDVVDPHDHTRPDAVGKAQGLSKFANEHGDLLGHIDLLAKVKGRYRRLHLDQAAVRAEVDAIKTGPELAALYERRG